MTASSIPAAARLGSFIAARAGKQLSPMVADKAGVHLLDALGVGLLGADEPTAQAVAAIALDVPAGPGTARLWSGGRSAAATEAIMANAVAVHAQFHDDSEHSSWSHPGSFVVPVAICGADALRESLELVMRAVAAGYAAVAWVGAHERVARAMIGRGVRTSPTLGTIAAAATGAVLLRLGAEQATHAVAMAASMTGGTLEPVRCGSDEWRLQNANAAVGGWRCAQLAARGVRGATFALEGPKGLAMAMAGLIEMPPEWLEEPDGDAILHSYVKPFATLGDNMAAARAAKLLHAQGVDADSIERVTVGIWEPYTQYPGTSHRGPFETPVQALASTVFAVATLLIYGELEYDKASEHREDPRILELVKRIEIVAAEDATHLDASVSIQTRDGRHRQSRASEAPLTWLYPTPETASATFLERLRTSGHDTAATRQMAANVFGTQDRRQALSVRRWLDALGPSATERTA
jgi:2-methylcitrate dehydratase PrpD